MKIVFRAVQITAFASIAVVLAACSRTLSPTENRLGHGAGARPAAHASNGQRDIPSAFGLNGPSHGSGSPLAAGAERGDTVYFASDSVDLTPEAQQALAQQAQSLARHPGTLITIEGHADERGTRDYNIGLGQKRAENVRAFLARQGVDASRMRTTSFGKERPVATCPDISCWSQNRRTQTILDGGRNAAVGHGALRR